MRSGWQSSEFWISVLGTILSLLVAAGVVPLADASMLQDAVARSVTAVFGFITAAAVLWKYIDGRTKLKSQQLVNVQLSYQQNLLPKEGRP